MDGVGGIGDLICNFVHLVRGDAPLVDRKNSSLGEMITALAAKGIAVPPGFAMTSQAYWHYVDSNCIREKMVTLIAECQSGKAISIGVDIILYVM
ncbi:hypothetical protein V491_09402 [Pseudogymnoascus sp. VKM F-3775]|nr:hypothetical protein V491_09402 [Pseudogymnoascus sp. VKM F-3775]